MRETEERAGLSAACRWQTGNLVVSLCLIGFCLGISSLVFSPSLVVISGCLGAYLQVFGALLLTVGIFLLPRSMEACLHLRASALLFFFLSPFATWDFLGTGGLYFAVNSMLWQLSGFECIRMLLRNYAGIFHVRGQRRLAWTYQVVYWLFFLLVFAPYCARMVDVLVIAQMNEGYSLRALDVWNSSVGMLDDVLEISLLGCLVMVAVSILEAVFHVCHVESGEQSAQPDAEWMDSKKELESDGDDINGGVGCVQ